MIRTKPNLGTFEQPGVPASGVSQVLHLTTSAGSGGDTFTITPNALVKTLLGYTGTATAAIAYNATAAQVQAALQLLFSTSTTVSAPYLAAATASTGGALPTQVVITLGGPLGGIATGTWTTTDSGGVTSTLTSATAGTTGAMRGITSRGDLYTDTTNHIVYENSQVTTGNADIFNPQWTQINGIEPNVTVNN